MPSSIRIGDRRVGPGAPCLIIGEAGVNHNGSVEQALRLIDAGTAAGVDAVKFQTFSAERLVAHHAPKARYQVETTGAEQTQYAMLHQLELPVEALDQLQGRSRERGVLFMSTPFDEEAADSLARLAVPALKLGSGELTNLPFLKYIGSLNIPVLLSTGMANLSEVERALDALGPVPVALLHCVSAYPTSPEDANLRAIQTLSQAFGLPTGFSDHTTGIEVALAAVALGACIIEKHFTLDRSQSGPDHRMSLEPDGLATLVAGIRVVEAALGDGRKRPAAVEYEIARVARRSVAFSRDLPAGQVLGRTDLCMLRPGTGLPSDAMQFVVGRTLLVQAAAGHLLSLDMLA